MHQIRNHELIFHEICYMYVIHSDLEYLMSLGDNKTYLSEISFVNIFLILKKRAKSFVNSNLKNTLIYNHLSVVWSLWKLIHMEHGSHILSRYLSGLHWVCKDKYILLKNSKITQFSNVRFHYLVPMDSRVLVGCNEMLISATNGQCTNNSVDTRSGGKLRVIWGLAIQPEQTRAVLVRLGNYISR